MQRRANEYALPQYVECAGRGTVCVIGLPGVDSLRRASVATRRGSLGGVESGSGQPGRFAAGLKPCIILLCSGTTEVVPFRTSTSAEFFSKLGAGALRTSKRSFSHESNFEYLESPKTSIAGLLIAVVTVAGVLSQQGSTWDRRYGHSGFAGERAASALLGLLAKDRLRCFIGREHGQTGRVGADCAAAWVAICERLLGATVAQDIVNWTPSLESAWPRWIQRLPCWRRRMRRCLRRDGGVRRCFEYAVGQAKAYLTNPSASLLRSCKTRW